MSEEAATMPRASYVEAAEGFRKVLRTDRFPVGGEIAAIPAIIEVTGVSHNTAHRAVTHLAECGDLLVRPGKMSVVLPPPDDAVRDIEQSLEAIDRQGAVLRGAALRARRTPQEQALELVRRTVAWLQGTDWMYPEQLEENFLELQRRLDKASVDDQACPVCQQARCAGECPLHTVRD